VFDGQPPDRRVGMRQAAELYDSAWSGWSWNVFEFIASMCRPRWRA
jgi:hypothetical protein